ncbi:hypothetical protein J7L70_01730 [Candidatus Bathyarchaeota archaeon]|nr:hypothetical protein [Candidatus Bathyarchaeota archaeon]
MIYLDEYPWSTVWCLTRRDESLYTAFGEAHEMIKTAAKLADEARELEKATDSVYRSPHSRAGLILSKRKLIEKPGKPV